MGIYTLSMLNLWTKNALFPHPGYPWVIPYFSRHSEQLLSYCYLSIFYFTKFPSQQTRYPLDPINRLLIIMYAGRPLIK